MSAELDAGACDAGLTGGKEGLYCFGCAPAPGAGPGAPPWTGSRPPPSRGRRTPGIGLRPKALTLPELDRRGLRLGLPPDVSPVVRHPPAALAAAYAAVAQAKAPAAPVPPHWPAAPGSARALMGPPGPAPLHRWTPSPRQQ